MRAKVVSGAELSARRQQQQQEQNQEEGQNSNSTETNRKSIWNEEEVPEKDAIDDDNDTTRQRPEYVLQARKKENKTMS